MYTQCHFCYNSENLKAAKNKVGGGKYIMIILFGDSHLEMSASTSHFVTQITTAITELFSHIQCYHSPTYSPGYCPCYFFKSQFFSAQDTSTVSYHLQEKFKLVFSEAPPHQSLQAPQLVIFPHKPISILTKLVFSFLRPTLFPSCPGHY